MVETHNVEFADDDIDGQKIVFFDGKYHEIEDVHIGNYDFRFNFNDKKYFSINSLLNTSLSDLKTKIYSRRTSMLLGLRLIATSYAFDAF